MRSAILSEGRAAPRLALRRTYQDVSIPGRPEEGVVRAEGLEPSRGLRPNGFSCHLRLSPPGPDRVVSDAPSRFVVWTIPSP